MAKMQAIAVVELVRAARMTTSADGSAVDLRTYTNPGGKQMKAVLSLGGVAGTTPSITVKIQHSDTTTAGDFADITSATFTAATTNGTETIHFQTTKRYVRTVTTFTSDTTQGDVAVVLAAEKRVI